ncbi:hypothetical protein ACFYZJ_35135 [Streptomyces sp. NPDC001848]|uniref:hypothetical protein n=1 Tax=Streptomyces sp. NPDC001848 TaxID=3364618 RepID=UPI0036C0C8B0
MGQVRTAVQTLVALDLEPDETCDDPMAVVARRTGFGSPESLRRAFLRQLGVTPGAFRASFRTTGVGTSEAGSA